MSYAIYCIGNTAPTTVYDDGDISAIKNAIRGNDRFVYLESITTWINLNNVIDILECED